jgi:hypothetical protein
VFIFTLIVLVFSRSFIGSNPAIAGASVVVKIHGVALFLWATLFAIQPFLIHFKNKNAHVILGKLSYGLVPVIVITTIIISIHLFHRSDIQLPLDKRVNLLCSQIVGISLFAFFYFLAMLNSNKPVYHLKYIIGTSFVLLGPVIFRSNLWLFRFSWFSNVEYTSKILVCIVVDATLLTLIGYDKLNNSNSRPYIVCLAFIAIEQLLDLCSVYYTVWETIKL